MNSPTSALIWTAKSRSRLASLTRASTIRLALNWAMSSSEPRTKTSISAGSSWAEPAAGLLGERGSMSSTKILRLSARIKNLEKRLSGLSGRQTERPYQDHGDDLGAA